MRLLPAVFRGVGRVGDLRRAFLRHSLVLERFVLLFVLDVGAFSRHVPCSFLIVWLWVSPISVAAREETRCPSPRRDVRFAPRCVLPPLLSHERRATST